MSIVIVGAGLAGATAAATLRAVGVTEAIVMLGAEDRPPYQRPPLSKGYLTGAEPLERALVHEPPRYAAHDVDLRLGAEVHPRVSSAGREPRAGVSGRRAA